MFFVEKIETLLPRTNYHGLNNITVKNRYLLPLLSTTFELLQRGKFVALKNDLARPKEAYLQIRI